MTLKYLKVSELKKGDFVKCIDTDTGEYSYFQFIQLKEEGTYPVEGYRGHIINGSFVRLWPWFMDIDFFNSEGFTKIGDLPKTVYTPEELEEGIVYRIINPIGANYIKPTRGGTLVYNPLLGWFFSALTPTPYLVRHLSREQAILEVADEYPSILGEL